VALTVSLPEVTSRPDAPLGAPANPAKGQLHATAALPTNRLRVPETPAIPTPASALAPQPKRNFKAFANITTLGVIGAIIAAVAIRVGVQPGNGLTQAGVNTLAILVPTIIMWLTIGTTWVSFLMLGLFIITGVTTQAETWATSFGNPIFAMLIAWCILANALSASGVVDRLAAWFISRPFLQGRPYAFLTMFVFSQMALGLVMQDLALGVLYIDIAENVCKKLNLKKGDKLYTAIMLTVIWSNGVLMSGGPIAKTWPLIMIGMLNALGVGISFFQWFAVGIPFMIVMSFAIVGVLRLFNPNVRSLKTLDVAQFSANVKPLSKAGKITSFSAIALVLFIVVPEIIINAGINSAFASWILSIGITAPAIVLIAALCIVRVDGAPVLDFNRAVRDINWTVMFFVGAIMFIGGPIASASTGIQTWMGNVFSPLFAGLSPMMIIIIALAGTYIMTQFISNGVTMMVFWTIGSVLLMSTTGTQYLPMFGMALIFAICRAVLTQPTTLITALTFEPGHVTFGNTWKPNLVFIAISFVVLLAFLPVIGAII